MSSSPAGALGTDGSGVVLREGRPPRSGRHGLFGSVNFFDLHASADSAFLVLEVAGQERGSVHFSHVGDGLWRNPARGTYDGWRWDRALRPEQLDDFVRLTEHHLRERGAQRLELLPPPMAHDPAAYSRAVYLMSVRGWEPSRYDLNQSMVVDDVPLERRMSSGNRGYVKKARREGLTAGRLPTSSLAAAHEVQVRNKAAKQRSFSMSLEQLQAMHAAFPDDVLLFGCSRGADLLAAAICLRVEPHVLYVFSWGHVPEAAAWSPVLLVAAAVYEHCQQEDIHVLDIGTSSTEEGPDFGLLHFKRGLGCEESLKVRMVKQLQGR